jgi:hypothetical protein
MRALTALVLLLWLALQDPTRRHLAHRTRAVLPPELCSCGQPLRPGHRCPTRYTPEEGTHA